MTVLIKSNQEVPKTLQGFFNCAWRWASRPEFKYSVNDEGSCKYRSDDGTRACFIGACIPDKLYTPLIEGLTASGAFERLNVTLDVDMNLLNELQQCHDSWSYDAKPKLSNAALKDFAKKHSLKIPVTK
jgi:hypothetical protein